MERIISNFSGADTFPLDSNTLAQMQNNTDMIAMLGAIAGSGAILSGGEEDNNQHTAGYVFVKTTAFPEGEILSFPMGANTSKYKIDAEGTTIVVDGGDVIGDVSYTNAHTKRKLISTTNGDEEFSYSDFFSLSGKTVKELREELDAIKPHVVPVGTISMWAGSTAPENYALCDGATLLQADCPELYSIIGDTYNTGGHNELYFRLPDLTGRFVVGLDADDTDFYTLGATGGAKTVQLTVDEMPSHTHGYLNAGNNYNVISHPTASGWATHPEYTGNSSSTGGNQPHNNLPPYFVLTYIIKIK